MELLHPGCQHLGGEGWGDLWVTMTMAMSQGDEVILVLHSGQRLWGLFHQAVCYENVNAQPAVIWQHHRLPYEITQRDSSACSQAGPCLPPNLASQQRSPFLELQPNIKCFICVTPDNALESVGRRGWQPSSTRGALHQPRRAGSAHSALPPAPRPCRNPHFTFPTSASV